ncbi:glycoside hydrolase [Meredithblackwellia eburnea MCA 4105]
MVLSTGAVQIPVLKKAMERDPTKTVQPVTMIEYENASLHIDLLRQHGDVDRAIYSAGLEYGPGVTRCVQGGIFEPGSELSDEYGFRKDVIRCLKRAKMPFLRFPGGPASSSYHWEEGVGARDRRKTTLNHATGWEEKNYFGTDEFFTFCKAVHASPLVVLNMATGTLDEALNWIEYMTGQGLTRYAEMRISNTGKRDPYELEYVALGSDVWSEDSLCAMTAAQYGAKAAQWSKAIKRIFPTVKLIGCGKDGLDDWDATVLRSLVQHVDLYSVSYFSGGSTYEEKVMAPAAADKVADIVSSLILQASIMNKVAVPPKICFGAWNCWDSRKGAGSKSAGHFTMTDAVATTCWLNMLVRQCATVRMACISNCVNTLGLLRTQTSGLAKQASWYPFQVFSEYMVGDSVQVGYVSKKHKGSTEPPWIKEASPLYWIDSSACYERDSGFLTICVVNRHPVDPFRVTIHLSLPDMTVHPRFEVVQITNEDPEAFNTLEEEKVKVRIAVDDWKGYIKVQKHSIQIVRIALKG